MSSVLGAELDTRWFQGIVSELLVSGLPLNSRSNVFENSRRVKSGPGLLFGFSVFSSLDTAQFIQVHDTEAAPGSSAVPVAVFRINTGAVTGGDHLAVSYIFPGRFFQQGIWVVNSTTADTYTAGLANCLFDAQFA